MNRLADDESLLDEVIEEANRRLRQDGPLLKEEMRSAQRELESAKAAADALVQKLIDCTGDLPDFFHEAARKRQVALDDAGRKILFLKRREDELRASQLHANVYRVALRNFRKVFSGLDRHKQSKLVRYLIDRIDLDEDGQVRMWMRGENPVPQKVNHPERKFSQGGEWLPLADLNCGPSD